MTAYTLKRLKGTAASRSTYCIGTVWGVGHGQEPEPGGGAEPHEAK